MAYLSNQCFAYEKLKRQIGQQCFIYRKLSETGELGSMPGMYQRIDDRCIPGESASAFLRGGVITTMACFEAFLQDLLDEAKENIKYMRDDDELPNARKHFGGDCSDCQHLKYEHIFSEKKKRQSSPSIDEKHTDIGGPMLHSWNDTYSKTFKLAANNDFIKLMMLLEKPMKYYYLLDDRWVSKIEIKDASIICLLLRLFYGIRCVMAHGSSDKTFKYPGALTHFPNCAKCINPAQIIKSKKENDKEALATCASNIVDKLHSIEAHRENLVCCQNKCIDKTKNKFKNIGKLSEIYDECIKQQGKLKVLNTARKFPREKPIKNLYQQSTNRTKGEALLKGLFPKCEYLARTSPRNDEEFLDENYAFFHLCRIHHWLEEDEREAYVTYNMLVRINQFILLLAHRMRFAMAKLMMDKFKLRPSIWNVPNDWKAKIEKIEKKHRKNVLDLQKPVSTGTKFCTVLLNK